MQSVLKREVILLNADGVTVIRRGLRARGTSYLRAGRAKDRTEDGIDEDKVCKRGKRDRGGGHAHIAKHRKSSFDTEARQPGRHGTVGRGLLKERIPLLG